MLHFTLACALLAPTLQQPDSGLVRHTYDLGALLPAGRERVRTEDLLPFLEPQASVEDSSFHAETFCDVLCDALRGAYESELMQPGRELEVDALQRLSLRAPAALHKSVSDLFAQLGRAAAADIEIDVLYASVSESEAALLPEGGLVASADLAGIAAKLSQKPLASRELVRTLLRVPAASESWLSLMRDIDLLVDYDVEIAQGAHVSDPILDDAVAGLRLVLRAGEASGGTWLACLARGVEPTAVGLTRPVSLPGKIAAGSDKDPVGRYFVDTTETRELSQLSAYCTGWALDTYVPTGKALVLRSAAHLQGVSGQSVLIFSPRARAARAERCELSGSDHVLVLRNLAPWAPPHISIGGSMPSTRTTGSGFVLQRGQSVDLAISLHAGDVPQHLFQLEFEGLLGQGISGGYTLLRQRKDAAMPAWEPPPQAQLVQCELTLRRGVEREPVARATCIVRAGGTGLATLGAESLEVRDYDVEVATGASVSDPNTCHAFQGLIAKLQPRIGAGGELVLTIDARARVQRASNPPALLAPISPTTLDLADADLLAAEQRFQAEAGGTIEARLGTDLGAGLGLEVRARVLK
jgi:hypothetical protein